MIFNPTEYHQALRDWLQDWVDQQNKVQPWGWKSALERDLKLPKGYIHKLPKGPKPEIDIINLVKIASKTYYTPSQILRFVENKLKK